ncbi:MAG: 2-oxoacid:acceptor oxidoreductase subunit alpha [Candidatus Nanoarchaeia archaeon]|nr:2-oxoacid:acceptor oxidoreductase subunit alpha [Candidatus Nanoarchaeia archaeon]
MKSEIAWQLSGEAGYGILSSGEMFSKILKRLGYCVFSGTEYPSQIRGGNNSFTMRASKEKITSLADKIDLLVALDSASIEMHKGLLSKGSAIICDSGIKANIKNSSMIRVAFNELTNKYGAYKKVLMATVGIGASCKALGVEKKIALDLIKERFKGKNPEVIKSNVEAFINGYDSIKDNKDFRKKIIKGKDKGLMLINGNDALSIASIIAGCKLLSCYPMTPTTSIMEYYSKHQESCELMLHQAEDEISAINVALGASYAGVRSLVATSGGGFALMNEAISLAGSAEIPAVIVLGQRPAPATGLPTRTEQGDLRYAIHAGHGDFPKLVLAPGDAKDCYELTLEAFNYSDKYQLPAIILTDKYLAVSSESLPEFKTSYRINRGLIENNPKALERASKFKRYAFTKSGISPRTLPGTINGMNCSIGDEHDEQGYIIEEAIDRKKMMDKRERKFESMKKELRGKGVEVWGDNNSKKVIVSFGSTKGIIIEALKELKAKFLQIKIVHPFPAEELLKKAGKHSKLIVVENNQSGQLSSLIAQHTQLKISKKLLKYDGRHFSISEIIRGCRNV